MNTSFWAPYISDGTVKAICWTLIHSLWIGMIIALLCGIVIGATRKSAAVLRYRLLCSLLVLFVCAIGVTYYLEARSAPAYNAAGHAQKIMTNVQVNVFTSPMITPRNQTFLFSAQSFLNQNANIIVLVWLLFFALKSLKMISGLLYIQRIKNYKTHPVTKELKHRIELLTSQIGIRRAVRLVQSELVKVPVAVGWLKPMILLPVGIAFQLTPEQLDGILWHELAHIRRRDYLVNILQGVVETVFFFNPGLLWLSSLIRTEREACCDDMVLSRMNRKANYLEALLSFGYGEFSQARYAMSIGSGNQLRDRLKRMISQENKRLSVAEKSVLAVGLVLLSAFTTISKDNPVANHLTAKHGNRSGKVIAQTTMASMRSLPKRLQVDDIKLKSREKDTIVVRDTAIHFISILFKHSDEDLANNDIIAMDDKGNRYHFVVVDNKLFVMELNGVKIADDKLANYQYMIGYIDRELAAKRRFSAGDMAGYKASNPGAKFNGKPDLYSKQKFSADPTPKFAWKTTQHPASFKSKDSGLYQQKKFSADAKSIVKWKTKLPNDKFKTKDSSLYQQKKFKIDEKNHIKAEKAFMGRPTNFEAKAGMQKYQTMRKTMYEDSNNYTAELQRAQNVIADLVKEKVVPNAAAVEWFGLSDTELIVNGQKQPDALQQQLKTNYGIHENYGLYYGPVKMTGTGVFIDK